MRPSAVRWAYMYACAMSPSVSRPSQPMDSHGRAASGSVAIIEEFIGSQVRRWPLRDAVKPSVQRRM